ncbi:cation:proton antiporter [Amycolatopsis sp. NPDC059090]|uniref:cation:proton antiporter n=1 Tax=unclassified Amycolatopsis TaxID=2618356 RepID=UPI00366FC062
MDILGLLARSLHVGAAVAAVLLVAAAGRFAARRLRQPEVVGEILCGVLAGPVVVGLAGPAALRTVLPPDVLEVLKILATAGVVLFLTGLTHGSRVSTSPAERRSLPWTAAGAFVPSLLAGAALAWWICASGQPPLRGTAPAGAFVLFLAVAFSVTAAPVLARILADRGLVEVPVGRIALKTALLVDSAAWLLLTVAVGLASGSSAGFVRALVVVAGAAVVAAILHRLLRTGKAGAWCARSPRGAAAVLAVLALAAAFSAERLGMTAILGAVLVGAVLPAEASSPWRDAVRPVAATGRGLVPLFFVITGVNVFLTAFGATPPLLVVAVLVAGLLAKLLGGYAGARLGGHSRLTAFRLGALVNTRGLTELVVLQVGYSAGIISDALFFSLLVLALAATAMTGPLLALADRIETRGAAVPAHPSSGSGVR